MKDPTFSEIFEAQRRVSARTQGRAGVPPSEKLNRALLALVAEVGELVQAAGSSWKWWKPHGAGRAQGEVHAEIVDVFLFSLLVAMEAGLTEEQLLGASAAALQRLELENP